MTPQQINRAIAEACGWTDLYVTAPDRGSLTGRVWGTGWWNDKYWLHRQVPNYYNDLNAMHEAIMLLDQPTREHFFRRALAWSVGVIEIEDWEISLVCLDKLTNATAAQRAEAFLRTIGKWEDGE